MTPSRNVRVPENRWRAGLAKAEREETTLAAKINTWIEADLDGRLRIEPGPSHNGDGPGAARRQLPRA